MGSAKWHWRKLLREWKTRILLIAFFLFFSSFSFFYRQQTIHLPLDEMRDNYDVTLALFRSIPEAHFEGETGEEVYGILANQQRLYGMQRFILSEQEGNTVGNLGVVADNYLDNGRELAENQLRLWELTEFDSYAIVTSTLDEPETLKQELGFYHYLEEHGLDIEWNPYSASQVFQQQAELIVGVMLFLFVALLASDRFTRDQTDNWSMTQGNPVPWKKQWRQRSGQLWGLIWLVTLTGMGISYLISLLRETSGSLYYPVGIYTHTGVEYIATWQYAALLIGMGMLLSYVLLLLTTGLSWIFRNVYVTIGLSVGIFFVPFIWQIADPFSSFQPSLYVHIISVVSGWSAEQFGLSGIHIWKMPFMFFALLIVLEIVFSQVYNWIPTQTMGLKRRESA